jgi:L-amino acid N-acyltransferase YncA
MVQLQAQKEDMKAQIMNNYKLTAKKEHTRILQRRLTIEQRKEQLEHLNDQRVRIVHEKWFLLALWNGVGVCFRRENINGVTITM